MLDVAAFCRRVDYDGPVEPTLICLRGLHRACLLHIPFENLDIHLGRPITLDEEAWFGKIVGQRRGGFCYELNGLFAAVLRQIGFDVTLLSARVFDADGAMGREFAHLMLLVMIESSRWITDVGFGESFEEPMALEARGEADHYRIRACDDGRHVVEQRQASPDSWKPRYAFTLLPRRLADFAELCHDLQTAPDSAFRRRRICTRLTPDGRVTLVDDRLTITSAGGERREIPVRDARECDQALREQFGIVIDRGVNAT